MPFEKMYGAFMFPGGCERLERAEISSLSSLRIFLPGVQTVLSLF
jgi:hypothetical protein